MVTTREHRFACELVWIGSQQGAARTYASYSREVQVAVAGKPTLVASAAAAFRGDERRHNPEDLLVAALAACHCLSYLAIAVRGAVVILHYEDSATGTLALLDGKLRFREVTLRPRVWIEQASDPELARRMHHAAHAECFIASSVNFPVTHEPAIYLGPPGHSSTAVDPSRDD